ncbi:60Kd inner membrane protein-domain-containing protein [Gigaspora margarita]|uniref:60Kd inner membrane protein-domain-containing protein n=1 Tax=Gigaspora margarita TaxID=4874 RepID=A0A8H4A7I9_GIGMA|nr:60Kd inner membrane protein-domain-containing protein [Gigaspora margarita]
MHLFTNLVQPFSGSRLLLKFQRHHLSPEVSSFTRNFVFHEGFRLSSRASPFARGFVSHHLHKLFRITAISGVPIASAEEPNIFLVANQSILEFVQNSTGLPWWATIIFTTIVLRSIFTLPIAIYQQKSYARLLNVQPLINSWIEKLKHKVARKSRMEKRSYEEFQAALQKEVSAKVKEIYREIGWHPIKSYLMPWYQIPLFICMSFTLREMINSAEDKKKINTNICEDIESIADDNIINTKKLNDFTNGGVLWFPDLTIADSTWFFPLAIGFTNLFNIEFQTWFAKGKPTKKQIIIKNIGRILCLIMIPVCTQTPTAICTYWLTSATFSAIQNVVFRLPYIQRRLGFPIHSSIINSSS